MKLISLKLTNFQGIKAFDLTINGCNATVSGSNGTGKTTIYNALTWLLFDRASTGIKGFSPKSKDKNGDDVHYLNHKVEGIFLTEMLTAITFTKDFHELYTKKRGSATDEFTGHSTDYYVDGVPVSKGDYDNRLSDICPPLKAQILTQPMYFPEFLPWQDRRKMLLDVCGDIADFDIISGNAELSELPEFLGTHTVDEYRLITAQSCKRINDDLTQIPARIDEATKAIPDLTGINKADVEQSIKALQGDIDTLQQSKRELANGGDIQEIKKKISDINLAMLEAHTAHGKAYEDSIASSRKAVSELNIELSEAQAVVNKAQGNRQAAQRWLENASSKREQLQERYAAEKNAVFSSHTDCPVCKQQLPADKIQETVDNFNQQKSTALENIKKQVEEQCSLPIIAKLEEDVAASQTALDSVIENFLRIERELNDKQGGIPKLTPFTETEEYSQMSADLAAEQEKLSAGAVDTLAGQNAIQGEIDGKTAALQESMRLLMSFESAVTQQARIIELKAQEKKLASDYEHLKKGLYLCDLFTKAKVSMLTESINSKFKNVRFSLFEEQINGGLKEVCDVMVPCAEGLVDYARANNAARINAGLEIIDTLGEHWGITMPVFIDNAESVVELIPINAQVIRLAVSAEFNKLTIN